MAENSDEIPCARGLSKLFRTVRMLATADVMHTHAATVKLTCGRLESHNLMVVKSNQPNLLARIEALARRRLR